MAETNDRKATSYLQRHFMDKESPEQLVASIRAALSRNVQHYDQAGQLLTTEMAIMLALRNEGPALRVEDQRVNKDSLPTHEPVLPVATAEVGQLVPYEELKTCGHFFVGPGVQRASWYGDDRCTVGEKRFARTGTNGTYWRRIA